MTRDLRAELSQLSGPSLAGWIVVALKLIRPLLKLSGTQGTAIDTVIELLQTFQAGGLTV